MSPLAWLVVMTFVTGMFVGVVVIVAIACAHTTPTATWVCIAHPHTYAPAHHYYVSAAS